MWPFRRARSGTSAPQAVHVPLAQREWASVDHMPLAVPPMTGTFGTAAFEAGLRSRQAPTFLESLGHDLSPTAPAGLVSGLATPAAPSPSPATVSRQTFDAPPWRTGLGQPEPNDRPSAVPTVARLAEDAPGALTRATPPSGLPTLQLSTVASDGTPTSAPVESTLQVAPTVAAATDTLPLLAPGPAPDRVVEAGNAVPTLEGAKPALDMPDTPTADRGSLVGEAPILPADRADTGTAAGRADTAPPNPIVLPDPPRRLGLGAPLPISHHTTSLQRSSDGTGPRESTHGRPHSSSADVVAPLVMPPAPPVAQTGAGGPEAVPRVVQRTPAADAVEIPDAAPATESGTELPGPTVETAARPLLSERPLPTASGVEATDSKPLDEPTPVEAALPPLVEPAGSTRPAPPVLREASETERSQPLDLSPRRTTTTPASATIATDAAPAAGQARSPQPPAGTSAAPLQRLPLLSQRSEAPAPPAGQKIPGWQRTDGSLPGETPSSVSSAPATGPEAGGGLPLPPDRLSPVPSVLRSPSLPSPDRPTLAGRPLSLSTAQRVVPDGVAPVMAAVQRQEAFAVGLGGGPVLPDLAVAPPRRVASGGSAPVARLSLPSPPRLSFAEPAAPDVVQRIPDVPDVTPPSLPAGEMPDVGAATGAATSAAGTAASALGGALGNDQLEELAKGLYDKIRQRLKAELRLDRERYGRVTDLAR